MSINERVKKIIDTLFNGNKRAFSKSVNVSATVIENIVGKRQGSPSFEVANKILLSNANISEEWFMTGKGNMLKEESTVSKVDDANNMVEKPVEVVSPASTTGNNKIIKLLEAQITLLENSITIMQENKAMQAKEIARSEQDKIAMREEINHLKQEITRLKNNSQSIKEIPSVPDDPMPPLPAGTSSKSRSHLRK